MSWRKVRVLIQHLPPESATWTALRNGLADEDLAEQAEKGEPEKARWSQGEQLIAQVADRVAELTYVFSLANSGKGRKPKRPEPIRRPGVKPVKPKQKLTEAQANHLWSMLTSSAA
ncbi:hypothetical protein [Streptomyces sp. NPDC088794]|uniref:hypothetical protein n=1 Tax=Streptomyces sp. NPDC088794 TaxID=3365902 RepID=UPI0037F41466